MRPWTRWWPAALLLAAACVLEPDYSGVACAGDGDCPGGYVCDPATNRCEAQFKACAYGFPYCDFQDHGDCRRSLRGYACSCSEPNRLVGLRCVRGP